MGTAIAYAVYDHEQSQDDVDHGPHLQTSRLGATGATLTATGIDMRRSLLNNHNLWLRLVARLWLVARLRLIARLLISWRWRSFIVSHVSPVQNMAG